MAATFAFLHHLAAFTLVAALAVQFVLLRDEITVASARKLQVIDTVYGIAAVMLLIVGLGRVFHFEKGATYYFHTWTFIAKLSLFVLVGLLSILPTLAFRSWRGAVQQGQAPQVTAQQTATTALDRSSRADRRRADHPVRRPDGQRDRPDAVSGLAAALSS